MDEMNELYYQDAYIREFDAEVVSCTEDKKGFAVVLSDTAFYPEGGGQPCDWGVIDDAKVSDVRKKDGVICHYTDKAFASGQKVHGKIDWDRRFDHMQQHSGEHVFSGLVNRHFGYDNIGFHMGDDSVTLDFSGPLTDEEVAMIEKETSEKFYENVKVVATFPTKEELDALNYRSKKELTGKVRIVSIEGADICACCGTHVRTTGEIGYVKVLSQINKKEGARVVVLFGRRARDYMMKIYDQTMRLSAFLSARPLEVEDGVRHLQDELYKANHKLNVYHMNYYHDKLEKAGNTALYVTFEDDGDMNSLRKFCTDMMEKAAVTAGLMKKDEIYQYVITSKSVPLRSHSKELNSRLNGRGGGSDEIIQGSFTSSEEEIRKVLKEMFERTSGDIQ